MFRPFALAGFLVVLAALCVFHSLATGRPSYLTGEDVGTIALFALGWINHWIWSD